MSIESEILRIQRNVANAYAAVSEKGGEVPLQPTSANLEAAVRSIQTGVTQEQLDEAMAVKQDKLTGQPGQAVGFGADGAAKAVPGWSNPNLLDNWYFADPINQRGQAEYSGTGYTIDRWNLTNQYCKLKVNQGYISLISVEPGVQSVWLQQQIERPERYFGKLLTFSVLLQDGTLRACSGTIPVGPVSSNTGFHTDVVSGVDLYAIKRSSGTACVQISALKTGPGQTDIVAMKLELGSQQTLAHQDEDGSWVLNDPPPNKALELAKCQRYFLSQTHCNYPFTHTMQNDIEITIPTPVAMRVNPAPAGFEIRNANSVAQTGFSFSAYTGPNCVKIVASKTNHGITSGYLAGLLSACLDANL